MLWEILCIHNVQRDCCMNGPKPSFKTFISFLFLRWKFSEERKSFLHSREFFQAIADNNMQFGLAVSLVVFSIGLAGLMGCSYNPGIPELIPEIPSRLVYTLMILLNVPQILFAVVEMAQSGESDSEKVLNINYLNQLTNAFMAGFAVFSTQKGSSLFFETVLIMLTLSSLPYWRRIRGYVVALTSMLPIGIAIVHYNILIPWQDRYDIVIFYILCLFIMTLRRHWLEQNFWLMHRTELENKALEKESRTDELTGLENRTGLREDFPSFAGEQVIMIMMDLDNFKLYNDRYGHRFGDEVLRKTGQYIRKVFQPLGGKCYRYGGDEFLIVLQDVSIPLLDKELELLRTGYMSLFSDGQPHTLSIGYSYGRAENESMLRAALSLADENLYASKAAGKNQICGKKVEASMQNKKDDQILSDLASVNYMDKLTGLLNREGFHKRLEKENLNEGNWAVICFNIDRFQEINRAVGYAGGNEVLVKVAGWLSRYFPESIISRHESDHFYVFTRCSGIERRIRRVQSEVAICREHCYIFFRAGIWSYAVMKTVPSLNVILDNAKYACDTLRNQSAHSMCFYSSQVEEERKKSAFVLNYFREALDKEQIEVYFQPIIGTMSKKCRGYEVLSRWVVPGKGILSPGEYIPVLEKSYDIYKLDLYVLRKACEFIRKLDEEQKKNLFVSFNLSRHDFQAIDIPEEVDRIVSSYPIPKSILRVEVTESALADDDNIRRDVARLRKKGYKVWVDDFGSGVSSLNVLRQYDVDGAKLDMKFLEDFESSKKSPLIIQNIIHLCHVLDLEVVVEGVENQKQLDFVQKCGGDLIQGFIYSAPQSLDVIRHQWFWDSIAPKEDGKIYHRIGTIDLERFFQQGDGSQVCSSGQICSLLFERDGDKRRLLRFNDELERTLRCMQQDQEGDMQTLLSRFKDTPIMEVSSKARKKGSLVRSMVSYNHSFCFVQTCVVDCLVHEHRDIVLLQFTFVDKSLMNDMLQPMRHSEGLEISNQ